MAALVALLLSAALFVKFVRLERAGRRLQVVLWVLGTLVVESAAWPDPNTIPAGLVHPTVGGSNFRLLDLVVLAAIAARLVVRGVPSRIRTTDLWWLLFFGWMLASAALGILQHNNTTQLIYEAKALAYLGTMWVAAGISAAEWRGPAMTRFLVCAGVGVGLLLVIDQAGAARPLTLPLLSSPDAGHIGSDAATVFGSLGILAAVRALHAGSSRFPLLAASAPLLLSTLAAGQRAALVGLGTALVVCVCLVLFSGQRARVPMGELTVVLLLAAALLSVPFLLTPLGGHTPKVPLAGTVQQALHSRGKQLSAQGRLNQWREVRPLLAARPMEGYGLGKTYSYYEPGPASFVVSDVTHNVAVDLVLRMGLVGLLLFGAALGHTLLDGLRAARSALDPLLSAAAIAACAAILGWVAKGLVESLFEKYRLAILLGILIGMISSLGAEDADLTGSTDWAASLITLGHPPGHRADVAT